jgi:hypothetical protein
MTKNILFIIFAILATSVSARSFGTYETCNNIHQISLDRSHLLDNLVRQSKDQAMAICKISMRENMNGCLKFMEDVHNAMDYSFSIMKDKDTCSKLFTDKDKTISHWNNYSPQSDGLCDTCEFISSIIRYEVTYANKTITDIENIIKDICATNPVIQPECDTIIDDIQEIVNWIASKFTDKEICQKLGLCKEPDFICDTKDCIPTLFDVDAYIFIVNEM